jgi:HPt (histidine-containing phosphotransfer) domain-containing protein
MLSSPKVSPSFDYSEITNNPPTESIDWNTFSEFLAGDLELMDELLALYQVDARRLMDDIRTALAKKDYDSLTLNAHGLKGASANVHANWMRHWAYLLEQAALKQDAETADYAFYELQQAFDDYQQLCQARQ